MSSLPIQRQVWSGDRRQVIARTRLIVVLFELQIAYVDLVYAFFFTCAFLFAHRALTLPDPARRDPPRNRERNPERNPERDSQAAWLLSGLCCGLIAGLKVTGILAPPAIAAIALPSLLSARRRGRGGAEAAPG